MGRSPAVRVLWSRQAIGNLTALRAYIVKDSEQSAADVAAKLVKAIRLLETQIDMGRPGRILGTRELVVVPYVIPYRVRQGRLEVLAVLHGSRRWPETL